MASDPHDPEARADALLAQLTLAEKIGQLNLMAAGDGIATGAAEPGPLDARLAEGAVGGVFGVLSPAQSRRLQEAALAGSRLGIPLLLAADVIHGHRTVFPLPLALACSWDMELVEETAAFAAGEARADGIRQVYAPMLDIARDPRWGRVAESPGEDPTLAAAYAAAMVRGYQGDSIAAPGRVAACLKHFLAYGAPQSGRDYDNASLAFEDLLDVYAPPFAAGVAAGAASVMAAFSALNRVPMHAHEAMIEGWLRGSCGFDGLVVSDYTGIRELEAHGLGSRAAVVLRALKAGVDMDMVGEDYLAELPRLAGHGLDCAESGVHATAAEVRALVDRACRRVLVLKARLGLFDDPFAGIDPDAPRRPSPEGRALARRAAASVCVLLKNDGILPLRRPLRIALVGPLAEARADMLGTWSVAGNPVDAVTLAEALAGRPGVSLRVAVGANLVDEPWLADRLNVHGVTVRLDPRPEAERLAGALDAAAWADVVVAALGEAREQSGESSSVLAPELPAPQRRLMAALAGCGKPVVAVLFVGRPLALAELAMQADALLLAWHGGVEGAQGAADVLFGEAEPTGRLAVSLPAHPGQLPLHHAVDPTGRPAPAEFRKFQTGWLDLPDGASPTGGLFPFGFGLGYTEVAYGPPAVDREAAAGEGGRIVVSVSVENRGARPTVETVQLYLSDPVARITRPARQLKAFRRVPLAPGERREVAFEIGVPMLSYTVAPSLDRPARVWDPGLFIAHVGPNSRDTESVCFRWHA